ncbi:hypothetical protein [Pseudoxanthomonas suwonensis]|nr:hypothetical protein [Pseudoxanthomonas suwonensis]
MSRVAAVALASCLGMVAQAAELRGVQVLAHTGPEYSFSGWRSEGPPPRALDVHLELGDQIYGATLQLEPERPGGRYRVQVQYETSMGLAAGGPHLDLLDWKHCNSAWMPAQSSEPLSFVLPTPTPEQQSCFPDYTREELEQAVRALGLRMGNPALAEAWLDDLHGVTSDIGVYPFVEIGRVRVKLEVERGGDWDEIAVLTFLPPMGC